MFLRVSAKAALQAGTSAAVSYHSQHRKRFGIWLASLGAITSLLLSASASRAQVLDWLRPPMNPLWNANNVFEPIVFPDWWDPNSRRRRAPEDRPVKLRQQPGYEAVGIRAGTWMFYPSMTVAGLYDSNVFATNTNKSSDVAVVAAPPCGRTPSADGTNSICRRASDRTRIAIFPALISSTPASTGAAGSKSNMTRQF